MFDKAGAIAFCTRSVAQPDLNGGKWTYPAYYFHEDAPANRRNMYVGESSPFERKQSADNDKGYEAQMNDDNEVGEKNIEHGISSAQLFLKRTRLENLF